MRVAICMETSGVLRRAFLSEGHDARSFDILPAEDDSPFHVLGDVFETLAAMRDQAGWWPDLAIFHPTCTYLTNSAAWAYGPGPYHQRVKPETLVGGAREAARDEAIRTVKRIDAMPIERKAMENPVGVLSTRFRKPDQIVQPYLFGDDASKATCLWLWGLKPLLIDPAARLAGRMVEWPRGSGRMVERWANQTVCGQNRLTPGDDRWKDRSRTYPRLGQAMVAWAA